MEAVTVKIHGTVQGVFFRDHTKGTAEQLGLTGWVQNESDGTVRAYAEGDPDRVKQFTEWCYEGSPSSDVTKVQFEGQEDLQERRYKSFFITG